MRTDNMPSLSVLWWLPLRVKFVCGNANSWSREDKHQCCRKTLYLCPLSHCALVEHDSCQGIIKTDRLQWWLLKITNGNSGKALQAPALSSATRPEEARFHGHQKRGVSGATNGLLNLSRRHLFWRFTRSGVRRSPRQRELQSGLWPLLQLPRQWMKNGFNIFCNE